jgi:hypothetical protein
MVSEFWLGLLWVSVSSASGYSGRRKLEEEKRESHQLFESSFGFNALSARSAQRPVRRVEKETSFVDQTVHGGPAWVAEFTLCIDGPARGQPVVPPVSIRAVLFAATVSRLSNDPAMHVQAMLQISHAGGVKPQSWHGSFSRRGAAVTGLCQSRA